MGGGCAAVAVLAHALGILGNHLFRHRNQFLLLRTTPACAELRGDEQAKH